MRRQMWLVSPAGRCVRRTAVPHRHTTARLRSAGDVRPAEDDDEFPEPLPLAAGREAPSVTLARLRRDER
ncbi:MAG: hypothetical protein ACRDTG_13515 [Pseudonocardiaceae bacterium]